MKKMYTLFVLLFSVLFLSTSYPQLLIDENFDYLAGQLDDVNGGASVSGGNWLNYSGTTLPLQVTNGSLLYTGYLSSGIGNKVDVTYGSAEDAARLFSSQTEGNTIYVSFLMNVTSTTGLTANSSTTGDYTVSLMPTTGTSVLVGRVSLRAGTVANTFNVGMRISSANTTTVWKASDYPINTTVLVVFSYQLITGNGNDVANLWINPDPNGTEPTPDATQISGLTTDPTELARITIRQGTNSFPGQLDGIRVGTSWNDLFPLTTPTLTVNPTSLTGFTYVEDAGPSTSKSYTLSGSNLTPADSTIIVAGSTNYEISSNDINFSDTLKIDYTGGTLADTTIYVRLKAGLTAGDYNGEIITNTGGGATQQDVTVDGTVTSVPVLSGDYYIPQGSNPKGFATLSDAVTALNLYGASGTVNFLLDADTLRENSFTFTATLSATNKVVVKPAPGKDVVLFVTAGASKGNGIQMIGFDRGHVTFDGSNNGTNSRNLIVSTETDAVAVPFGLNTSNADTVVLKNLIIKNLDNVTTNFRYGAVINDKDGVWGFRVENCQIGTPERPVRRDGLAPWGASAANQFSFVNNEIYCGTRGVTTLYLTESEIIGNTINVLPTTAGATDTYNHGIYITGATGTINIKGNTINCLEKTINASSYLIGIAFAGNGGEVTDVINVVNNIVNAGAADETRNVYGIGLRSAQIMGNLKVYFNTILINDHASTLVSYGIGNHTNGTGSVNIDLKNNIIINNHTANSSSAAIGLIPLTSVLSSDYNNMLSFGSLVNFQGTVYLDLASWQATSQDLNSVSKAVNFVSDTDLHLTGSSNGDFDLAGTPITGITTDIDGDTRGLYPYMGADEASIKLVPWVTIAVAREDLNADGKPDRLGETLMIRGVVISPNFQTTNHSYYIWDGTAGIAEILFGTTSPVLSLGDSVEMVGKIDLYRGLTEFSLSSASDLTILGSGSALPNPLELTLAQYKANPEMYEGTLLKFNSLNKVSSSTWPGSGSSATLKFTDGVDTVDFRIDSDTEIDGSTEPIWPANIVGIGSQFSTSATSYFDGYQILPRYISDFTSVASSVENENTVVTEFALAQNYPNPFNPSTRINYSVPTESKVTIAIYSITGELVAELVNEYKTPGNYSVNFDGSRLASGMYIYRMTAGNFVKTNKMMLLK